MTAAMFTEGTLRRTYRASALVFLGALLLSLGAMSARLSLGIAAGYAVAVLVLLSWQFIVKNALAPSGEVPSPDGRGGEISPAAGPRPAPQRGLAVGLGLAKLPILGAVVYALIGRGLVSPEGFAAGFVIPQVTLALMAVGRLGAAGNAKVAQGGLRP
jgi:hypothetical protein